MIESHDYQLTLANTGSKTGRINADGLPDLAVASPPEFGGPDDTWSPEHLYVAAISACLMTTFRAIAEASNLEVLEYSDKPSGHLQRGSDRLYSMDVITLRPTVVVSDEGRIGKAERLLEKAEKVCLISRSVNSRIELQATITAATGAGLLS